MLSNSVDQKTRFALASYDFGGPAAAFISFDRRVISDIFSFAGPIKTINLWLSDPETADLTQAGFIAGGSYEVFDHRFKFQYQVVNASNFGLTQKDIQFLEQAPHGSYYYVCFDSKYGRSLALIWICQEPDPAVKRRIASQWRDYHTKVAKPAINEIYLDTSNLSSAALIYFIVLEGNYNVNMNLDIIRAQGIYNKFDPRYPLYIRPRANMWLAFLQDERPLRVSEVLGDGYEKFRSRNGVFHVELQSKRAWHGVIRLKLVLQDALPPPPPPAPPPALSPTESSATASIAPICTATVTNISYGSALLICQPDINSSASVGDS